MFSLPLARQRESHDRKPRSVERQPTSGSPATKSPSPRSRNRMSSTPELREGSPSPPSPPIRDPLSTPSPTPKPPTPRTRTPPVRTHRDQEPEKRDQGSRRFDLWKIPSVRFDCRRDRGVRAFGSMYGFPDEDGMADRRRPRRSPSPISHSRHRSSTYRHRHEFEQRDRYSGRDRSPRHRERQNFDVHKRHDRRGYSYRPSMSPPSRSRLTERRLPRVTFMFIHKDDRCVVGKQRRRSVSSSPIEQRRDLSGSDDFERSPKRARLDILID